MLVITVPGMELFDQEKQEFFTKDDFVLTLEHSLVSLSKWEQKYEKPFLGQENQTAEEMLDYIRAMILTPDVPETVINRLSEANLLQINEYLGRKMTATWFAEEAPSRSSEKITAELIYYWMFSLQIPMECENWHLNRLFTQIKVALVKNSKPKKMSQADQLARNRELNMRRRAQLGTRG